MRGTRLHSAILRRYDGAGYLDENENWVAGTTTDTPIRCNIQPFGMKAGIFLSKLPQGVSQRDCMVIYTKTMIRTASQHDNISSDSIVYNDIEYEVFQVDAWPSYTGNLTHYEGFIIRKDKMNA